MIRPLEWDSGFFSLKIGRADLEQPSVQDVEDLLKQKAAEGYDIVYLFMLSNAAVSGWMESRGLPVMDEKTTFEKTIPVKPEASAGVGSWQKESDTRLEELALMSGHKSRFYLDARLNHRFEELYLLWLKRSLNRELADEVLVHTIDDQITGFVTLLDKNNCPQIGLIAVHSAYRGKGIGSELLRASDDYWYCKGIHHYEVVTQKSNTEACRLYVKNQFTIKKTEFIYHL